MKKWAFKEWGYRTMLEGVRMTGDVLKEFISLDKVNHYDPFVNKSRSEWVDVLLNSDTEYLFCGILDVSESLDCYIYTEVDKKQPGYCDAFALLVKNGKAIGSIQLACEGYGLFDSIESNRISRNTFVMSSHAVDVIDENGDSPGGYYFIRINDDGTVTRSNAYESDFDKPTWKEFKSRGIIRGFCITI